MKRYFAIFLCAFIIFLVGLWYADATNPYGRFSIIKPFFSITITSSGQMKLTQIRRVTFVANPLINLLTYVQRGFRTISNAQFSEKPFIGDETSILEQIHSERFDITKPYVISGAHFAELYVRNAGIFYNALLDPRVGISQKDWENRESVTLQTIALDLALLKESGKEYTTFVPMWSSTFTGVNWATQPSDSLFSLFYTLTALTDNTSISNTFPAAQLSQYSLQTQDAGKKLLEQYKPTLEKVTNEYITSTIDPTTGLIKTNITLSSARDGIKRQSSFYDNVIAWSTAKLATNLGLTIACPQQYQTNRCDFDKWKQTIISAFWDEKTGIFLDDLSTESKTEHIYSADVFIITSTQFLDVANAQDRNKLEREISYVEQNKLDSPFPLQYGVKDEPNKLYFFVRFFAPSYMGQTIWSHWGIEYIKTLIMLSKFEPSYITLAKEELASYKQNIEKFGGYPEVYDTKGAMYQTPFYKSILHTGWVINYEEATIMLKGIQ